MRDAAAQSGAMADAYFARTYASLCDCGESRVGFAGRPCAASTAAKALAATALPTSLITAISSGSQRYVPVLMALV